MITPPIISDEELLRARQFASDVIEMAKERNIDCAIITPLIGIRINKVDPFFSVQGVADYLAQITGKIPGLVDENELMVTRDPSIKTFMDLSNYIKNLELNMGGDKYLFKDGGFPRFVIHLNEVKSHATISRVVNSRIRQDIVKLFLDDLMDEVTIISCKQNNINEDVTFKFTDPLSSANETIWFNLIEEDGQAVKEALNNLLEGKYDEC